MQYIPLNVRRRAMAKRAKSMNCQNLAIKGFWSQFQYQPGLHSWVGDVQPDQEGKTYTIKVVYLPGQPPRVYVLNPVLQDDAPHRNRDGSLGLYYPPDGSWNERKLIANTIMPWACEYLYFYETWQVTGEWFAPSVSAEQAVKDRAAGRLL